MFQACTSQTWTKCGSSLVIQSASWAISKYLSSSCRSLARIQSDVGDQPAKAAQRDGGKSQDRRRVFQRLDPGEAQRVAIAVH